jgi:hypothetical protein
MKYRFSQVTDMRPQVVRERATDVIKESLLNARKIGQKQLEDFVEDRLVLKDEELSPKIPLLTNQQKQSTNNGILL